MTKHHIIHALLLLLLLQACRQPEALPEETVCTIPPPPLCLVLQGVVSEDSMALKLAEEGQPVSYTVTYPDTLPQTVVEIDGSEYLGSVYENRFLLTAGAQQYEVTAALTSHTCSHNCTCYQWANVQAANARHIDTADKKARVYF